MKRSELTISRRFRGPPDSANGGYICGRLGQLLGDNATVRLQAPPPLEAVIEVVETPTGLEARWNQQTVATARPGGDLPAPPGPPDPEHVMQASARYAGFDSHWYPGCFVCGPDRAAGDGLRIFAGPLDGAPGVAAPWVPGQDLDDGRGRVRPEFLWAALDCPGAFAFTPAAGRLILLGELSVAIHGTVTPGEACNVLGWSVWGQGRKHRVGTALYGPDGDCRAAAGATWIELA